MTNKIKVTFAVRKSFYFTSDLESAKAEMLELYKNPVYVQIAPNKISVKVDDCHVALIELLDK